MFDENILRLQDMLRDLSDSSSSMFSFEMEELENTNSSLTSKDLKALVFDYYQGNLYVEDDSFLFTLTEMMLDVDEDESWLSEVRNIFEKYEVGSTGQEILDLLQSTLVNDDTIVWQISPDLAQDYAGDEETGREGGMGDLDMLNDSPNNMPPIDQNWRDYLFKINDRYFILHLGSAL